MGYTESKNRDIVFGGSSVDRVLWGFEGRGSAQRLLERYDKILVGKNT